MRKSSRPLQPPDPDPFPPHGGQYPSPDQGIIEPGAPCDRPQGMRTISRLAVFLFSILMLPNAFAAPPTVSPEDRYIAVRDAAIEKSSKLYDAGKFDDGARKAEDTTRGELQAQMIAILGEPARKGFAPPTLNLDTFYKGDQGFGMLDGLRFNAEIGKGGEKAGKGDGDKYV